MADAICVLCLNAGSSSLKYAAYRLVGKNEHLIFEGKEEEAGNTDPLAAILEKCEPDAVGHRIVHGGPRYSNSVVLDEVVLEYLNDIVLLAPNHIPQSLSIIEVVRKHFPQMTQIACFDTAFHQQMPELAKRFALPSQYWDEGIRRYGFHGLSYQYIVESMKDELPGRVIIAHLGNGCSLLALKDGKPVDTTMGFTPSGGVVMGTRIGDIDPGVILYIMRKRGMGINDMDRLLNHESGILGVSGLSSDMRKIVDSSKNDPASAMALDLFCYSIQKHTGSLTAVLGGLDLFIFTGGIGENSETIRKKIMDSLDYLSCTFKIVSTNESLMIARNIRSVLKHSP